VITFLTPASACTLSGPSAAVVDAQGNLFVADTHNNRVLEYGRATTSARQDATAVYGQNGNFVSAQTDQGGVSASSLFHPLGLAFGLDGHLWVSDYQNMRVLEFPAPNSGASTTAMRVLGQHSSFGTHGCAVLADTLCGPTSVTFDGAGHTFVADGFNNRVLEFSAFSGATVAGSDGMRATFWVER
jgi:sugar lactone lactonase YvrE